MEINYLDNCENGVVFDTTSNLTLVLQNYGHVEDNIIIYLERLKT